MRLSHRGVCGTAETTPKLCYFFLVISLNVLSLTTEIISLGCTVLDSTVTYDFTFESCSYFMVLLSANLRKSCEVQAEMFEF